MLLLASLTKKSVYLLKVDNTGQYKILVFLLNDHQLTSIDKWKWNSIELIRTSIYRYLFT